MHTAKSFPNERGQAETSVSKEDAWETFLESISEFTDDYFEIIEKRECNNSPSERESL